MMEVAPVSVKEISSGVFVFNMGQNMVVVETRLITISVERAYGAIGKWMYAKIAGIDYDEEQPGYKNIVFAPVIGGTLTHASAWHETPYGNVSSFWTRQNDMLEWRITIPANATGTLVFPTSKTDGISVNGNKVAARELKKVPSGTHIIKLRL